MTTATPDLDLARLPTTHLLRLSDRRGVFEHALADVPRHEHGYCTDDVARALEYVVRESLELQAARTAADPADPGDPNDPAEAEAAQLAGLTNVCLTFVERAIGSNGGAHNRMAISGQWTDAAAGGDWWGRAVSALGTAAAVAPSAATRERATAAFRRAARWAPVDLRSHLFAAVGASEALKWRVPEIEGAALTIISRAVAAIGPDVSVSWPWPEPRLRYANGIVPDALMACGTATGDHALVNRGLYMLDFLLESQTRDGHLSLVGHGGRGPADTLPQFDQQPIEAVTLANACARAYHLTRSARYRDGVTASWEWFLGRNDTSTPMIDPDTGAGYDGLHHDGRNDNRGAESTLAALATYQVTQSLSAPT